MPDRRILVLDGGMGTTLENLGVDVSSSLWGSDLFLTDPTPIKTVHEAYVEAGADLIESATYPLSVEGIQREYPSKSIEEAEGILHVGLQTALAASGSRAGTVLALGPYGATTKPGAEYSGLYAPPYGFGTVLDALPTNCAPTSQAAQAAGDALYEHHRRKLSTYARSDGWRSIEWIGFETIPLVREVTAIRRAFDACPSVKDKKVWVACTFPDGQSPQTTSEGSQVSVGDTVRALLNGGGSGRRPDGIGINCTNPAYVPALVDTFNETLQSLRLEQKPWFVLYPDGGQVYEPISRTWSKEKLTASEWAGRMMEVIERVDKSGLWAGIIAGGCCKTSADEIKELRRRVDQYLDEGV